MAGRDLGDFLQRARTLSDQVASVQGSLARTEVTGTAGDGAVAVTFTAGEFLSVRLDPDTVRSSTVDELEDLVLAALRDGSARLREQAEQGLGSLSEALGALRAAQPRR